METGVHIGNKVDKGTTENLKEIIAHVFRVGAETRMEQATIVAALDIVKQLSSVSNITLQHVNVIGNRIEQPTEEEEGE